MIRRSDFLRTMASTAAAAIAPLPIFDTRARIGSVLVLGGGGARGAYEAGIVEGLRRAAGVVDGQRIPGIDVVCGTSIGSVNAWFVATGRYTQLAALWHGVAAENVFRIKRRFAATTNPHAFVIVKIVQALALAQGLTKNVQGILDGQVVEDWLERHVDPATPLLVPFVCTLTNLDVERSEVLYRLPFIATDAAKAAAYARIRQAVSTSVVLRPATDELLRPAIRASAAIPVLFDPVTLPAIEGGTHRYVDGGIADNNPVDIGRALARAVYAVMVDPAQSPRKPYDNALQIAVGAFGIAQDRITESALRATYLETRGKRLFDGARAAPEQRAFLDSVLDADLFIARPATELPVETVEFDRQEKIDAAYAVGLADIARGWTPYVPSEA